MSNVACNCSGHKSLHELCDPECRCIPSIFSGIKEPEKESSGLSCNCIDHSGKHDSCSEECICYQQAKEIQERTQKMITELASFIATSGKVGEMPDWYPLLKQSQALSCQPWILEGFPINHRERQQVWIGRALVAIAAEIKAGRMRGLI